MNAIQEKTIKEVKKSIKGKITKSRIADLKDGKAFALIDSTYKKHRSVHCFTVGVRGCVRVLAKRKKSV